jgi:hypothetical protein
MIWTAVSCPRSALASDGDRAAQWPPEIETTLLLRCPHNVADHEPQLRLLQGKIILVLNKPQKEREREP